jgi:hypothetical protein
MEGYQAYGSHSIYWFHYIWIWILDYNIVVKSELMPQITLVDISLYPWEYPYK